MTIHRIHRKRKDFSMILNEGANDPNLTWAAAGLLWYLLTKPDKWEIRLKALSSVRNDEKEKRTRTVLKELEHAGYVVRWCERGEQGRLSWFAEIFESKNDRIEWLRQNKERIDKSFRLSKGTSTMMPDRGGGQNRSNGHSGNSISTVLTTPPISTCGDTTYGAPSYGAGGVLLNTDEQGTELKITDLVLKENKRPSIVSQTDGVVRTANAAAPPFSKNGHGEEKKLPHPLEPEAGNPPLALSLSTQSKPEQDKRSIDKVGAAARAKKTILAQTSQPQHCPDGFKAWWNLFRGHAQKNNLKPGTRSESVAAWDVLHEAAQQIATGGTSLAEAIINGTEHYWEREGMGSFPTVKHGCRFLAALDWLEATEWYHVHQSSGAQLAPGGLETFLVCWNQDRPVTWPQADESDLSLVTSQLERFIASGPNAIERFQSALRHVRRDEYWSLQRTLTFGEFLSARQLNDWSKKQANDESLGIGDRVGGLADAAKRAKRRAELNQILLELQEEDARKQ